MRAWLEAPKVQARFSCGAVLMWRPSGVTNEALARNLTLPEYVIPSVHEADNSSLPPAPYSIPLRCNEATLSRRPIENRRERDYGGFLLRLEE
jgi:hypothetical protein